MSYGLSKRCLLASGEEYERHVTPPLGENSCFVEYSVDVAGRALQVGVDRRSSLAFKGAGTETDCSE